VCRSGAHDVEDYFFLKEGDAGRAVANVSLSTTQELSQVCLRDVNKLERNPGERDCVRSVAGCEGVAVNNIASYENGKKANKQL
jgi:hypothetical protein